MSDFNDRLFCMGSLVGVRSFGVDALGRLVGPAQGGVFKPGDNEAGCNRATLPSHVAEEYRKAIQAMSYTIAGATGMGFPTGYRIEGAPHEVASKECHCGYYAYFDEGGNPHHNEGNVLGLIEGYGVTTVGSRGFRSAKAKLVALIGEPVKQPVRYWRSPWLWIYFVCFLGNLIVALLAVTKTEWQQFGINGGATTFAAIFMRQQFRRVRRNTASSTSYLPERTRALYPDVPVYPSLAAALAEHPLTPPPSPSPETHADFWDLKVSS